MANPSTGAARRLAWRAFIALALLLIGALASQPWWLGRVAGHRLSASSGRAVHFDSMRIGLNASLEPVLVVKGVDIANASWADTRQPFAKVGELVATLSWRSLREQRPVLSLMRLRDGTVHLEQLADGSRNWRLIDPEDRGPGRYKVLALQAQRLSLRIVNRAIGLDLQAEASENEALPAAETAALPTRIDFTGTAGGTAFQASVSTSSVITFVDTGDAFHLHGHIEASGVRLEAQGKAGDILKAPRVDASVHLTGDSLAGLGAFFKAHHPAPRRFEVAGRLTIGDGRYALSGATGRVGKTDLRGELALQRGPKRNAFRATLQSDSTDVADIEWLTGRRPSGAAAASARPTPPPRLDFQPLRGADARLVFEARRLRSAGHPALQSLSFDSSLDNGALSVARIDLGYAGGHITGRFALDASLQPTRIDTTLDMQGVSAAALLPAAGKARLSGTLRGRLALASSGESAEAWLANASGSLAATLSHGTISSGLDALLGLQLDKIMRTWISGDGALPLRCATLTLEMQQGRGRLRNLVLESANTRITGSGSIDLRGPSIDVVLTPSSAGPRLLALDRSIALKGKLPKPERTLVDRPATVPPGRCKPDGL